MSNNKPFLLNYVSLSLLMAMYIYLPRSCHFSISSGPNIPIYLPCDRILIATQTPGELKILLSVWEKGGLIAGSGFKEVGLERRSGVL